MVQDGASSICAVKLHLDNGTIEMKGKRHNGHAIASLAEADDVGHRRVHEADHAPAGIRRMDRHGPLYFFKGLSDGQYLPLKDCYILAAPEALTTKLKL